MSDTRLRGLVATIGGEIARAPANHPLRAPWGELVALLALGPEPTVRACPACQKTVMGAATRCGYCWTRLPPTVAMP